MFKRLLTGLGGLAFAAAAEAQPAPERVRVAPPQVQAVAPALARYTDEVLFGDNWARPDLKPRDRSLVTVAALVAGGHTAQMKGHFTRALDNGLKPEELSAVISHLAFYAGWPNAMSATGVAREVFTERGVATLAESTAPLLPRPPGDDQRAASVRETTGPVAPALARYTNEVLFDDLWRRPDLSPRDRSLATVSSLIARGDTAQLSFHLGLGLRNGLTREEVAETITHLAFYAGWPRAMSAVPVAKAAFDAQ